ncbi:hypothetical protein CHUAL_000960 [Chamberlinius hualienensis]
MAEESSLSENALTAEGIAIALMAEDEASEVNENQITEKVCIPLKNDLKIKFESDSDNPTSQGVVTEMMIQEEKRLEDDANKSIEIGNKKQLKLEEKVNLEERYAKLQKLLQRSKFYTQYLGKKLSETKPTEVISEENATAKIDRKRKIVSPDFDCQYDSLMTKKFKLKPCQVVLSAKDNLRSIRKITGVFKGEEIAQGHTPDVAQPRLFTGGIMRQYQIEGLNWMKVLYENGINGILGDEMGLGKTIQCIALISYFIECNVRGPFLIVAPLSTLPNWITEFTRFTPSIPTILYHGPQNIRRELIKEMKLKKITNTNHSCFPVIITSYQIILKDIDVLKKFKWTYLIVDEGQRIKNMNCLLIARLKLLYTKNRLLMTGTPLQNSLAELWSLLNFLLPELFRNLEIFESWFDATAIMADGSEAVIIQQEREKHIIATLREILEPFLLRRVKRDVEVSLPPKRDFLVYASLTVKQNEMYKAILNKTISNFFDKVKDDKPVEVESDLKRLRSRSRHKAKVYTGPQIKTAEIKYSTKNCLMDLRKCVSHPYLLEYPLDLQTEDYLVNEEIIKSSGKLAVLDILLKKLIPQHKVVIFSQMVEMLNIIHDYCVFKSFLFRRLDGSMRLEERMAAMDDFKNDPNVCIFLISTRAGGVGLNLAVADTVILYDSDWNPQCDLQAMDRCHRIGQTKPVVIYRLVVANTIDEHMVKRAAAKRKLEKMIIHKKISTSESSATTNYGFSTAELLELLKSDDHDKVVYSNNLEVFSPQELELLLDRSFGHKDNIDELLMSSRVEMLNDS